MQNAERLSPEQIREFLQSSQSVEFVGQSRAERYEFVQRVMVAQEYALQDKKERGAIRAYLSKVTGLSLPQITRLIGQYRQSGVVEPRAYRRRRFPSQYTHRDVELLAEIVFTKELAPPFVKEDPVRLEGVLDPRTWLCIFFLDLHGAPEEIESHERRLTTLPRDGHLRDLVGFKKLPYIGLVDLIRHPEAAPRVEFLLFKEEAVIAIEIAG